MEQIWEVIKCVVEWYINSDLPRATTEYVMKCITYVMENFIPLMWEYYNEIFGVVAL